MPKLTFPLNVSADQFTEWLRGYICTLPHIGCSDGLIAWETVRGSHRINDAIQISVDAVHLTSSDDSARVSEPLEGLISFTFTPMILQVGSQVEARYEHPAVKHHFRSLLIQVAHHRPEAAKAIADHFPPDLPDLVALKKMAIVNMSPAACENRLRRFARDFPHRDQWVTKVNIEGISRELLPHVADSVGPLTPLEETGWSIAVQV